MQLWLWPNDGVATKPAPIIVDKETDVSGNLIFTKWVPSSFYSGPYRYEYQTLDASGKVLDHVQGTMVLGSSPSVTTKEIEIVVIQGGNSTNFLTDYVIARSQDHNAFGEIKSETDTKLNTTNFSYNVLGELIKKVDPAVRIRKEDGTTDDQYRPTTQYFYDKLGRSVATTDAFGLTSQYFDAAGHLLGEYHASLTSGGGSSLMASAAYSYDVFGNRRTAKDVQLSEITQYSYDLKNQLVRVDYPTDSNFLNHNGSGNAARYDLYQYDEKGRRIKHTNALGYAEKTYYDDIGRVRATTSFSGITTRYDYLYDSVGGGTTFVTTEADGRTLTDTKNYFGRLTAHTDLGGHSFSYTYNQAGWLMHQQGDTDLSKAGLEQNIDYTYYQNGYQKEIIDHGVNSYTKYEYDENGNRTFEGIAQNTGSGTQYYQFSRAQYDALNRITRIDDPKYNLIYEYDQNGNRRHVYARYHDGLQGHVQVQDYWYTYDAMNRFLITKGTYSATVVNADGSHSWNPGGSISAGTDGYQISYVGASERATSNNERYVYTKGGLLAQVWIKDASGVEHLRATRTYDAVGNVKDYYEYAVDPNNPANQIGPVTRQSHSTYINPANVYLDGRIYSQNDGSYTSTYSYDAKGNLDTVVTPQGSTTLTTKYSYDYWDSAKQKRIQLTPSNTGVSGWMPGFSDFAYDANGHLTQVRDYGSDGREGTSDDRFLSYKLDSDGRIVSRNERRGGATSRTQNYYYFNGRGVGDAGGFGSSQLDYTTLLAFRGQDTNKSGQPVSSADFDYNFQPINDQYPATTPGSYTVQIGDVGGTLYATLQNIALAAWGDQSLWYLIADANGFIVTATDPNATPNLAPNQVVVLPNVVTNLHNDSTTFKPYNPGELIGDTTPTLPDPPPPPMPKQGGGCGVLGQIIMIVVAIVVTIFTAGAALAAIAPSLAAGAGGVMAAGSMVLTGGLAGGGLLGAAVGFGIGVVAGAAGSIASQLVGMATGNVQEFSWGAVASSALTSGLGASGVLSTATSAISSVVPGGGTALGRAVVGSAVNNVAGQGINIITRQQDRFDWRGVAASVVSGAINYGINKYVPSKFLSPTMQYGSETARGVVTGAVSQIVRNGKVDWSGVATNAFGSVLGNMVVRESIIASMPEDLRRLDEDAGDLNNPRAGDGKGPDYARNAYAYMIRAGESPEDAARFSRYAALYGYTVRDIMQNYNKLTPAERQAASNREVAGSPRATPVFYTQGAGRATGGAHYRADVAVMGENPQNAYFQEVVDFLQGSDEAPLHAMRDGNDKELTAAEATNRANYLFRSLMARSWSQADAGQGDYSRLLFTGARHMLQDSASAEHRYDKSYPPEQRGQLRPWPPGKDSSELTHIWGEKWFSGPPQYLLGATRLAVDINTSRYIPEGNIFDYVGVDSEDRQRSLPPAKTFGMQRAVYRVPSEQLQPSLISL